MEEMVNDYAGADGWAALPVISMSSELICEINSEWEMKQWERDCEIFRLMDQLVYF